MRNDIALLLLATTPAFAGEIVVPDDALTLGSAIAMSQPGDTITVRTAGLQGEGHTIPHALTIVGDPVCRLKLDSNEYAFKLAGPGSGEVVLANIDIGYLGPDLNGGRMIHGEGFDALTIVGSSILHDTYIATGTVTGVYPAVEVWNLPRLNVIDSRLEGGSAGNDGCAANPALSQLDGRAGIDAPDTEVLLVQSDVRGGGGGGIVKSGAPCPPNLLAWHGEGGDGVIAASLFAYESVIVGGNGALFLWDDEGFCEGSVECGVAAGGTPVVVSGTHLDAPCARLGLGATFGATPGTSDDAVPQVGGTVTFQWDGGAMPCWPALTNCGPNCVGLFFLELEHPIAAVPFLSTWMHIDPAIAQLYKTFPAHATRVWSYPVPNLPALVGAEWSAQAYVSNGELSNPVFGTVR